MFGPTMLRVVGQQCCVRLHGQGRTYANEVKLDVHIDARKDFPNNSSAVCFFRIRSRFLFEIATYSDRGGIRRSLGELCRSNSKTLTTFSTRKSNFHMLCSDQTEEICTPFKNRFRSN